MRATGTSDDPGHGLSFPGFAEPSRWITVTSGLARLGIGRVRGPEGGPALRFHYDFGAGAGFVVARHEVALEMPAAWEASFCFRGQSPANSLEIKLLDPAGSSVWRWTRSALDPPQDWTGSCIASRDFEFAWGPAGGGSIARTSAIEIAIVAGPGGKGFLEVANFHFIDRSPARGARMQASSQTSGHSADRALDADGSTSWRSEPDAGPHDLCVDLDSARDLGGVVIHWDPEALPHAFRVEVDHDEGRLEADHGSDAWATVFDVAVLTSPSSFVELHESAVRRLRVVATAADTARGVGVIQVDLKPVEWSRTTAEFLTNVAIASRRGAWPRYLLREQTYWTPVASPRSGPVGLLNDDGAIEVGEGGFMLEPSLLLPAADAPRDAVGGAQAASRLAEGIGVRRDGAGGMATALETRWLTWADVERSARLEADALPLATAAWRTPETTLAVTAIAEAREDGDAILVRYRVGNPGVEPLHATLLVGARPFQVTPPWQSFRNLGGPSPIRTIEAVDGEVVVNGAVRIVALSPTRGFAGARFEEGGLAGELSRGMLPAHGRVEDPRGRAEGLLAFDVELEAGSATDVFVECQLGARRRRLWTACTPGECAEAQTEETPAPLSPAARFEAAARSWQRALPAVELDAASEVLRAQRGAVTAIGHVLACRDGAALQPGPRRYTRSWIRDGAIMSAALLRAGRGDAARAFVEWYAPFQREDGFVPSCVDRDGVDPLVEHDSHGQLIYAVAETYRFGRDLEFARAQWPRCAKAAAHIETLRAQRKTAEFQTGSRRECYGLLPESVSHEGYLAQPVHSYWDDFWALRGLRDAAFLARELGLAEERTAWLAAAANLTAAIVDSMQMVSEQRHLSTVPASVEWADFDPTAIAGAIALVGAGELFPAEPLARTFDQYLRGFRARHGETASWNNYSPYEVRIVGALVHMGRRDDAVELLAAMLADRRPHDWHQWPEIVWRQPGAPAHLGDLPHCWIGAEYAIALRSMVVYERERDDALVIGAGLPRAWLEEAPLRLRGLPTWYGSLDLSIERSGSDGYRVVTGGSARPPGGFVAALPGDATID